MKRYVLALSFLLAAIVQIQAQSFNNITPITIIDNNKANIYPSNLSVSGLTSNITTASVIIRGFTHDAPGDVAMVLQAPTGQKILLQEGFWGGTPASNLIYMVSDVGAIQPDNWSLPANGTYKPATNNAPLPSFPTPGPGTVYNNPGPAASGTSTMTSTFAGINANGTWKLWIIDVSAGGAGTISGGWTLVLNAVVPLPVKISKFDAKCNLSSAVEVNWTTVNEENSDKFILQASNDGNFFEDIQEIQAAGNSNIEISYKLNINPDYKNKFLRLKTLDLDGKISYSEVIKVNCDGNQQIVVSPNPFTQSFEIINYQIEYLDYKIIDLTGREILSGNTRSVRQRVNMENYPKGIYSLVIKKGNQFETIKLVLQ